MLKTKSALSYFGSDSEVAPELASMLDHCKHVTIPFCGGLSILPHLKARAIVANDLHSKAINFYRHMSGVYGEDCQRLLIERCQKTLSHPDEMIDATMRLNPAWNGSWVQAWAFWAVCWIGRKGKGGTKHQPGMPSVRRTANGGTNASRIRAASDDLVSWVKHFERCEWESVCFRQLLPKVSDSTTCGIYCDPPWVEAGDNYLHAFDEQDHIDLAECLSRFESSTVVVRYGDHPLIRQYYGEMGWKIIEAESRDQCNAIKGELWITNK
jgi:site-specific DNA-adenine methylase